MHPEVALQKSDAGLNKISQNTNRPETTQWLTMVTELGNIEGEMKRSQREFLYFTTYMLANSVTIVSYGPFEVGVYFEKFSFIRGRIFWVSF